MKDHAQTPGEQRLVKKGSRGDDVRELQRSLAKLGFELDDDGIFGDDTEKAVIQLQTMFGYTVDGIVGEGTRKLIVAQIGYGWNVTRPDAAQLAMSSQRGPGTPAPSTTGPQAAPAKGAPPAAKPAPNVNKGRPS